MGLDFALEEAKYTWASLLCCDVGCRLNLIGYSIEFLLEPDRMGIFGIKLDRFFHR